MPRRRVPVPAYAELVLVLVLAAFLSGAALGHTLFPPVRWSHRQEFRRPGSIVAIPLTAAASPTLSTPPERRPSSIEPSMTQRHVESSVPQDRTHDLRRFLQPSVK